MGKRIRIEPRTNGQYTLSETNPNPGGQTLESPYGNDRDITGPYVVFHRAHVTTSGKLVFPVVSLGTMKAILLHVEAGGEIGQAGSGRPGDDAFDGGEPTDGGLVALRGEYQRLASRVTLAELMSWDEFLESKGVDAHGSPNASSTRELDQTGVDPNATDLLAALTSHEPHTPASGEPAYKS